MSSESDMTETNDGEHLIHVSSTTDDLSLKNKGNIIIKFNKILLLFNI